MIDSTRKNLSAVAFIEGPEQVHYPTQVRFDTRIEPATPTRPRRNGAWYVEVVDERGGLLCERDMAADADRHSLLGAAMCADARATQLQIPALAGYHPDLEVTGLSHEIGGWLAGQALRYDDAVFAGCFPQVREVSERFVAQRHAEGALQVAEWPGAEGFAVPAVDAERVSAMLLGVAIGDALGSRSESMTANDRRARFGWIDSLSVPVVSDDTQMTLRTLHSMLRKGRADPADLHRSWSAGRIHGIGRTVRRALGAQAELMRQGRDPWGGRVVGEAAGNGSLMRVAGVLAPYARCHPESAPADLLLASDFTHDDASANAACLGWAAVLLALGQTSAPLSDPQALFEVFLKTARPLEGPRMLRSRSPHLDFSGSLCDFIEQRVMPAHRNPATLRDARDRWYSGAFVLETVPTVLSIIAEHLHDPHSAILEAVNRTWDNDTIASMVASAMGMRYGDDAFDPEWRQVMLCYTPPHPEDALIPALERVAGLGRAPARPTNS